MCGAMKNNAFDLRWWSLDQALTWISSRDPDAVVSGSSWVDFRADRLGVWNPEIREHEYDHADLVLHPQDAEQQLLRALQNAHVEGLNGVEKLDPIWFDQAEYIRNLDATLLVNWHLPATVQIKMLSDGGQYIQRVNPDENKIPVRVPSAQVLSCFPAQGQATTPQKPQGNVDTDMLKPSARATKSEVEAAYRNWIAQHEGRTPPSRAKDEAEMLERFPHLTRDRIRDLRNKHAPDNWKRKGRRKLAE
jgi:hypothetical protein